MMRFRFGQWLQYRRAAKGRHGVHSPFVFHLIENALRRERRRYPPLPEVVASRVPEREAELLRRLLGYFEPEEWRFVAKDAAQLSLQQGSGAASPLLFRRFIYLPSTAAAWKALVDDPEFRFCEDDVLVLSEPHGNPEALAHWRALQQDSGCTLSLDFLRCGLLLFRREFQVVQHLVLRFPA